MDDTYTAIGMVGRGNPSAMASLGKRLRTSSAAARAIHIGRDNEGGDRAMALYLYGREDGKPGDIRPTVNRFQGTVNTFTSQASRIPPTITLKSASVGDDGPWILIKPWTVHAPRDPATGQPAIDPATGQPGQDIELQIGQVIPEELIDDPGHRGPPAHRRWQRTHDNICKWQQKNFDVKRRQITLDEVFRDLYFRCQLDGWPMGLVEWNQQDQVGIVEVYEPQQWYPDPIKQNVEQMNYVCLDIPMDAQEAKRRYPDIAEYIDQNASRALHFEAGSTQYSSKYTDVIYETPVVTIAHTWLRNQPAPMTLDEAEATKKVTVEYANAGPGQANTLQDQAGAQGQPPVAADAQSPQGSPVMNKGKRIVRRSKTQEDISDSFDGAGNPGKTLHDKHPQKWVIRHWIQIMNTVAPGSDEICEWPDINVFLGRNVPIKGRPFSQSEAERLRSPQITLNNTHEAIVNHCAHFRTSTMLTTKAFKGKMDPDLVNGNMRIGKWYAIEPDITGPGFRLQDHIFQLEPPKMSDAIPALKADISNEFQLVAGNPSVNQGTPPPGVTAGTAIRDLQTSSQSSTAFKSMYLEVTIKRVSMLLNYAYVHWMAVAEYMRINQSLPQVVVEKWVLPFMRSQMTFDIEVSLVTGFGQVEIDRKRELFEYFKEKGVDEITFQEGVNLDSEEIQRRKKELMADAAEEQARLQATLAPPAPPAKANPK